MLTLLVANRGEIALRIFRTAARMGLRTVAVYSDADADSPFVRAADVAQRIGPAPAADSYLRRDRIIEAAQRTKAHLIHPGYGFLAEDDRFAFDCESAGITFVGPPSGVLRLAGDKASARAAAMLAGVRVLDGYGGRDQTDQTLAAEARRIGFPVLVKPAGGGGGKGMAVVRDESELARAVDGARRIAKAAFDDDALVLERFVTRPRHVEVQVLADAHGNVIHLGERDCSLQRRHQKILEESPAPGLDAGIRRRLHESAVDFARHVGYLGAGTCEFLVADATFGFIEMNARLQVEHPVTEMVTGLDLVELQIRVAMGEPLPFAQQDVAVEGHAIEVRVYAEDPQAAFLPQAGRIEHVRWPDTRVDSGIEETTMVPSYYDPLIAKIVVHGADRAGALFSLQDALSRAQLLGVRTNLSFLADVARDPVVSDAKVTTDWLEDAYAHWTPNGRGPWIERALAIAAAAETERVLASRDPSDPWSSLGGWRAGGDLVTRVWLRPDGTERSVIVRGAGPFAVGGATIGRARGCHAWWVDDASVVEAAARCGGTWFVWSMGFAHEIAVGPSPRRLAAAVSRLDSPLPGRVIAVRVRAGKHVAEGDELCVVEAMKMEHSIRAPADGIVRAVLCATGDQVDRGQALIDFDPA